MTRVKGGDKGTRWPIRVSHAGGVGDKDCPRPISMRLLLRQLEAVCSFIHSVHFN